MGDKKLMVGEQLSDSQRKQLQELLEHFQDVLTEELGIAQGVGLRSLCPEVCCQSSVKEAPQTLV